MSYYYDRASREVRSEKEMGGRTLRFLYRTPVGRFFLKGLVGPGFANWEARRNDRPASRKRIAPFAAKYGVKLEEAAGPQFPNFNAFFTRKLKPGAHPVDQAPDSVIAVADAKLKVEKLTADSEFSVKGSHYTLAELLQDEEAARLFKGGSCWIYRLAMDDYHRYCYPDNGLVLKEKRIKGVLHTIRPLAHSYTKVFAENTRVWQLLETERLGKVLYCEVGAMLVGRIHDHGHRQFEKGQEKGYFGYGGSTIVLCFQEGSVQVDADIVAQNKRDLEVQVKYGEKVGECIC